MRILKMTATFGKLEHAKLELQPGLNIIKAPNEWGKSTWCAFILAMLYGIDSSERTTADRLAAKEHYKPWSGQPMSGRMEIEWNGKAITIERANKGRGFFNDFNAYETTSGLPVAELTEENCGQMLLGVEKEVFARAGFLRLADLPVTQDEALRRRLNALVTTGDESGASDVLAQKLKALKNSCRHNKTGLLPQAEAQKKALEDKLEELNNLQLLAQNIEVRQKELDTLYDQLLNHQTALQYAASAAQAEKLTRAQLAEENAQIKYDALQVQCEKLSDKKALEDSLLQLQTLRYNRDELHAKAQMLPPPPQSPESLPQFRGLSPEAAITQAKRDADTYKKHLQNARQKLLPILGGIAAAVGAGLLFVPSPIAKILGGLLAVAGVTLLILGIAKAEKAKAALQILENKYAPLPPEIWVQAAENNHSSDAAYRESLASYNAQREALNAQLAQSQQQLDTLTGGRSPAQCQQQWQQDLQCHQELEDVCRQLQQAKTLVLALKDAAVSVQPPKAPDSLTLTEEETARQLQNTALQKQQLQLRLGQVMGQMNAIGQADDITQKLALLRVRISRLENIYAALELAQSTQEKATAELQRRFAPRISKRAQEIFFRLTGGRYDRLALGQDLSLSAGTQDDTQLRQSRWRSDGTVDQLYLSLRLAVAEELTPDAPLVLDDALVRFDDKRLTLAMDILKEEADTKQVILFTCQSREKNA